MAVTTRSGRKATKKNLNRTVEVTKDGNQLVDTYGQKTKGDHYEQVVQLHEQDKLSERMISARLNIPKSTVHDFLSKWKQRLPVAHLRAGGRPKLLNDSDVRFIRTLLSSHPLYTVKDVRNELHSSRGKQVSSTTVRRTLKKLGLKFGSPQIVPLLTDRHKTLRIEWCKSNSKLKLRGIFFSDETYIELGSGKSGVWHKTGKRPKVGKPKFPVKLMFWAAVSCQAKSPLLAVDGTMNTEKYITLIRDEFLPWVRESGSQLRTFQQDNASCHVSKAAVRFFEEKGITLLDWPANSPDLNPIENIWAILKEKVRKRNPQTKEQLRGIALEEWASISQSVVCKTINSLRKRCTQVLERGGEKCDY